VRVGIGDDAAVLSEGAGDSETLVTTDLLVEGVHFNLEWASPYQVGWKAAAASVSDIAAMGGRPTAAVVSIGVRPRAREYFVKSLYEGIAAACERYGVVVAGGDTVRSDKAVVNIAMLGRVMKNRAILRKGAVPGDIILVTDTCGDSAAGLEILKTFPKTEITTPFMKRLVARHLVPEPSLAAALAASASLGPTAMMDLSDGLAADLPRLASRSGVGAVVFEEKIPTSPDLRAWARRTNAPFASLAVRGGEDFNLLITASASKIDEMERNIESAGARSTRIGEIVSRERGITLVSSSGENLSWPNASFLHF
jgi:thiamine-monophosphate kinase